MSEKVTRENAEKLTRERYQSTDYAETYKKEYVEGVSMKGFRSKIIARNEIDIIERYLTAVVRPGIAVLDLPCGTGKLGSLLSGFDVSIIAGDVSAQMLGLAKSEYTNPDTDFRVIDATDIDIVDGTIDVVVCLRLFQRLPKATRARILSEFNRINNKFLIISYSYDSLWQKIRSLLRGLYVKHRNVFFSENISTIRAELHEAGYEVEDQRFVLPGLSSELIILAKKSATE